MTAFERSLEYLFEHLDQIKYENAYQLIQIARFVHLPDDLNDFCQIAENLTKEPMLTVINETLTLRPDQPKLHFIEFVELADLLQPNDVANRVSRELVWLPKIPIFEWVNTIQAAFRQRPMSTKNN